MLLVQYLPCVLQVPPTKNPLVLPE
jgi:hypothetical protein